MWRSCLSGEVCGSRLSVDCTKTQRDQPARQRPTSRILRSVTEPTLSSFEHDITGGLTHLRKKLLDLSLKNHLLNLPLKHTLRVIDELPDELFSRLLNKGALIWKPLPELAKGAQEELRESATAHAKSLGFLTDYELPANPTEEAGPASIPASRHTDNAIQTLLYPAQLQSQLRKLHTKTKSLIDETGTNCLYLAFGLIEWYEAPSSDRPLVAPLVMVPVTLERGVFKPSLGCIEYKVVYEGEEIWTNATLREMLMRNVGIALPELDEDETPDAYCARVAALVHGQPRWRARREVCMGLLSFSKLLMYLDLDPSRWPSAPLQDSALITSLFRGESQPNVLLTDARPEAELLQRAENIVIDADSSQHTALADALDGHNLVIEGPPGTGKSQTITNLIASTLAAGKTVLFVAEKLTALEVVKRKLTDVGLGHFCLELHSHATKKAKVVDDIKKRIELRGTFLRPFRYFEQVDELARVRTKLNKHAEIVRSATGANGKSVYDVLWGAERRARLLPKALESAIDISLPAALEWKDADFESARTLVHRFTTAQLRFSTSNGWAHVLPNANPSSLLTSVRAILETSHAAIAAQTDLGLQRNEIGLREIIVAIDKLVDGHADRNLVFKLLSDEARAHAQAWASELTPLTHEAERLAKSIGVRYANGLQALRASCENVAPVACDDATVSQLQTLTAAAGMFGAAIAELTPLVAGCTSLLGTAPLSVADFALLLLQILRAPQAALAYRVGASHAGETALTQAESEAAQLRQAFQWAETGFDLSQVSDPNLLRQAATTIESGGLFRSFSAPYKGAEAQYRAMRRQAGPLPPQAQIATELRGIAEYVTRAQQFFGHAGYRQALGPSFAGLATPFAQIRAAIVWQRGCLQLTALLGPAAERLAQAPADTIVELAHRSAAWDEARVSSLSAALEPARGVLRPEAQTPWATLAQAAVGFSHVQSNATLLELTTRLQTLTLLESRLDTLAKDTRNLGANVLAMSDALPIANELAAFPSLHGRLVQNIDDMRKALVSYAETLSTLERRKNEVDGIERKSLPEALPELVQYLDGIVARRDELSAYLEYRRDEEQLRKRGLHEAVVTLLAKTTEPAELWSAIEAAAFRTLALAALEQYPALREEGLHSWEAIRDRFRALDKLVIEGTRDRIAADLDECEVPEGKRSTKANERTELTLLQHEVAKQKRHVPLRDLLRRAPNALIALKPCFMMGPRSVAQYLEPGSVKFDLVVMDEASQLRPEDAIGVIARAKQLVVVGDSKQLPPTSFFALAEAEGDEADEFSTNHESILDVARSSFSHVRRLRWHYRSAHESLIQFSNERYYDRNLLVFPSPSADADESLGVRFTYVEGGRWTGTCNLVEADAVVDAAIKHLIERPSESLGIVAMNVVQRDLIIERTEVKLRDQPELFAIWNREGSDAPFVKNLESVQGDERDVIFISATYGRKEDGGTVHQRFGPINGEHGPRRLNVLFTRARKRVHVFASFRAGDLAVNDTTSAGVRDFRDYLDYAETGSMRKARVSTRAAGSDFEVAVAEFLGRHGYEAEGQIGVAGFYIDLAVRHPERRDVFVLGVECDGARFHSSVTARDRDRLRQAVLEKMGWKIHRVWSTDWFVDRKGAGEKLLAALGEAKRVGGGRSVLRREDQR